MSHKNGENLIWKTTNNVLILVINFLAAKEKAYLKQKISKQQKK